MAVNCARPPTTAQKVLPWLTPGTAQCGGQGAPAGAGWCLRAAIDQQKETYTPECFGLEVDIQRQHVHDPNPAAQHPTYATAAQHFSRDEPPLPAHLARCTVRCCQPWCLPGCWLGPRWAALPTLQESSNRVVCCCRLKAECIQISGMQMDVCKVVHTGRRTKPHGGRFLSGPTGGAGGATGQPAWVCSLVG